MAGSAVRISILANASNAVNGFGDASRAADKAGDRFAAAGESADTLASTSSQVAGGLGDLGGALSVLPGPLGAAGKGMEALYPAIMGVTGAADLANAALEKFPKLAKVSAIATKTLAVAQRVLGVAIRFALGPVGLIILGITALAAVFVLAYKKSETFRKIVDGTFSAIKAIVNRVLPPIRTAISGAWSFIQKITSGAFSSVRNTVVNTFNGVVDFIRSVPDKLRALVEKFKGAGKAIMDGIINGMKSVGGFVGDIASGVYNALRDKINDLIRALNAAIPNSLGAGPLSINLPDNPIPMLANGGIVNRATLAVIGEAGPEAVIPLSKLGMMGTYVNIQVNVPPTANPVEVGRQIQHSLDAYYRAGGRRRA